MNNPAKAQDRQRLADAQQKTGKDGTTSDDAQVRNTPGAPDRRLVRWNVHRTPLTRNREDSLPFQHRSRPWQRSNESAPPAAAKPPFSVNDVSQAGGC
ncbi:MAG: hypothetical protein BroJett003_22730 [Planctomycetota bacterium]|nr:MAG: hypothetical protein BroJett003_22730 [Planctomycetota bacterium]